MKNCLFCNSELTHVPGRKEKSFCNAVCRNKYFYAKAKESKEATPAKVEVQDFTQPTNVAKPPEQPKTNYSIHTAGEKKPRNLEELKALCPPNLKGIDRTMWLGEYREKYGI